MAPPGRSNRSAPKPRNGAMLTGLRTSAYTEYGTAVLFPCRMQSRVTASAMLWIRWSVACCRRCLSRGVPNLGLTGGPPRCRHLSSLSRLEPTRGARLSRELVVPKTKWTYRGPHLNLTTLRQHALPRGFVSGPALRCHKTGARCWNFKFLTEKDRGPGSDATKTFAAEDAWGITQCS